MLRCRRRSKSVMSSGSFFDRAYVRIPYRRVCTSATKLSVPGGSVAAYAVADDFLIGMQTESALTDVGIAVLGIASTAEEAVLLSEDRQQVLAALARLSRRRREVLVLRFYVGLSEAEIAATLGISAGTVKSTAARGLAALARVLRETR